MLLLRPADVPARRAAAAGGLAPLAHSLAADLDLVLARDVVVPAEKARLTRVGGRCSADGTLLAFDPWSPHAHRCPACGAEYRRPEDYRWWIMWYQLWLAERAVHASALHLLTGDVRPAAFAERVLDAYADRYLEYPDRDNVLGPGRPFFSTYLESIWLLQLCMAVDLLELAGRGSASTARVRDRVVEPSRRVIASYDEGGSNRQVWNVAALLAAARLLGDDAASDRALHGPSGLVAQLGGGLLADGTWFEGENYHQFAHRGLWYGVTMAAVAGAELPAPLVARFDEGFVAPFLTALPDLTLPARRDSQYAISLRQWRYAESCELGLARRDDPRLAGSLARLYDPALPRGDTGRSRSAAESERNEPAVALSRADLGWRSLLCARAELPPAEPWAPPSVLLDAQGLAVLRRAAGRVYLALDYGHSGGGHGHPDRLNVLWSDGPLRVLDDMGTGSYVERALHWYRSTLAHNAPLVGGRSQPRVDGVLHAHDERGRLGWVDAGVALAAGVEARRTLVVDDAYAIDRLAWSAAAAVQLDLPIHARAATVDLDGWRSADAGPAIGLEDGFGFLSDARCVPVPAGRPVAITLPLGDGRTAHGSVACDVDAEWWSALAPAAPGRGSARFHFVRAHAAAGTITTVWQWPDAATAPRAVELTEGRIVLTAADGARDEHRPPPIGGLWSIERHGALGVEHVALGGARAARASRAPDARPDGQERARIALVVGGEPAVLTLGADDYRRSEQTWDEAGRPTAEVSISAVTDSLVISVEVQKRDPHFVAAGALNEMDNERADVNGDGVQLYVESGEGDVHAWLLVPEGRGQVRQTPLSAEGAAVRSSWRPRPDGYLVAIEVPFAVLSAETPGRLGVGLVVNESTPGRERRRGQLVLGGARGEFVYLQGDRLDRSRFVDIVIQRSPNA